jgi:hypothetical protein
LFLIAVYLIINQKITIMKTFLKTISIVLIALFISSCSSSTDNNDAGGGNNINTTTNGTATFVLDGVSNTLDCLADRSTNPDGCGKINVFLYKSGQPSFTFYHFPEDASGTFTIGDGNTQRSCNQIYAYVSPAGYFSKTITLTKTAAKSFKYTGTVYDPVTNVTHSVSGEGSYKN